VKQRQMKPYACGVHSGEWGRPSKSSSELASDGDDSDHLAAGRQVDHRTATNSTIDQAKTHGSTPHPGLPAAIRQERLMWAG